MNPTPRSPATGTQLSDQDGNEAAVEFCKSVLNGRVRPKDLVAAKKWLIRTEVVVEERG